MCTLCVPGYHLANGNCYPDIPNCDVYEPNGEACNTCRPGYYLFSLTCRQQYVPNCVTYLPNLNFCQVCLAGFQAAIDGTCVQGSIPNCVDQTQQICNRCAAGFYTTGSACLPQNVLNCQIYEDNANRCAQCNNGYYLQNGACLQQFIAVQDAHVSVQSGFQRAPVPPWASRAHPRCHRPDQPLRAAVHPWPPRIRKARGVHRQQA